MAPKKTAKGSKKSTAKSSVKKLTAVQKAFTKGEMTSYIASQTNLAKKDVAAVFETLYDVIGLHLKKRGAGEFTLPGIMKCRVIKKPATKARKGINPFTGEEVMFKAKPARNVVKIRPLKKLKAMVE